LPESSESAMNSSVKEPDPMVTNAGDFSPTKTGNHSKPTQRILLTNVTRKSQKKRNSEYFILSNFLLLVGSLRLG
jgi:hypothetical protein